MRRRVKQQAGSGEQNGAADKQAGPGVTSPAQMGFREWVCKLVLSFVMAVLIIVYLVIPVLLYTNPWLMARIVFMNMVKIPPFFDLTNPRDAGLNHTRNFYLQSEKDIVLGIWHTIPRNVSEMDPNIPWPEYEPHLVEGQSLVLYLHGNGGTRAGWHRAQLYKVLGDMNFHVIAPDYRGFGDSSGSPSEEGLVRDAEYVYRWLHDRRGGRSPLYVWGHSLGSAVATKLVKRMSMEGIEPDGLILESPFNRLKEAAMHYPLAKAWQILPCFKAIFLDPLERHGVRFDTEDNIEEVKSPILILHAKDDGIVPYKLGLKVERAARRRRPVGCGPVELTSFDAVHGYGHKHIHKSVKLPGIVRKFMERCDEWKKTGKTTHQ